MPASNSKKKTLSRRDLMCWSAAGVLASAVPMGYADLSTNSLPIERFDLTLPNWDVDGFRVGMLSDLHMVSDRTFRHAYLAATMLIREKPDVILLPGDFVESSDPVKLGYIDQFLRRITEWGCPAYATMGNHDYATAQPRRVIERFEQSKVRLLRNEVAELSGISIAGIDDGMANRQRPDILRSGTFSKSLLVMMHEPDYVADMPDSVSLQVSGHSHGGQICLPGGIPIHTPYGARNFVDGYYSNANVPLFVSRGIGTTGVPYRMFCPPQIAILTLHVG